MKLKKLEINGFKSFEQKTSIEFPLGISAVVGPNGCGKSNLVDAIRWVMGEQSVKQLRGKSMEDIIFSGANGKAPLNMAEVSLTMINDNGTAPEELKDFSEIMLTRRLYRSGESAYFINKQQCRLKDIHNVFMGSGLGAKSYAVIQQGNIGAITEAGPEERRYFIEEAAGVTRFINRKNEALRKVQATNHNLVRVTDIITEVKRQMNSLKRQARKAEIYNKYRRLIKDLDVRLALHYVDEYTAKINETNALIESLKDTDIEHTTRLKRLDAAIEQIKQNRWQKNQEISDQKNHKFETQRQIDRTENDLAHIRKDIERLASEVQELDAARIELEQKNQSIRVEIDDTQTLNARLTEEVQTATAGLDRETGESQSVRDQLAQLNQELELSKNEMMDMVAKEAQYKNIHQTAANNRENLKKRLKQMEAEEKAAERLVSETLDKELKAKGQVEGLKRESAGIEGDLKDTRGRLEVKTKALGDQIRTVRSYEYDRSKAHSRFVALKKMEENYEWYKEGVKAIMKRNTPREDTTPSPNAEVHAGVIGLMADIIEPAPSYETAVEAALGDSLQYILVRDQKAGCEAIRYLQAESTGRSGFVPVATVQHLADNQQKKPDESKLLLNQIKVKKGFEDIARAILGHVVLAGTIDEALEVFNKNGVMQTIVTPDGDVISPQGIMIGGSKENLSGILRKKQEIKDLQNQIAEWDGKIETAGAEQDRLESEVRQLENHLHKLTELKQKTAQQEIQAEKDLYKAAEEYKHARRRLEIVCLEQEQLRGEENDIDEEISKSNGVLAEIASEVQYTQERVTELNQKIGSVSAILDNFNQRTVELKLKLTSLNARLENNNHSLNRLQEFQEEGLKRLESLAGEIFQKRRKGSELKQRLAENEQTLSQMYQEIKQIETVLETNEADYLAIDNQLRENDGKISELQAKREDTLQKIRLLEIEQSQQQLKCENIKDRIEEQYHRSFSELKTESQRLQEAGEVSERTTPETEAELSKLKEKIAKITDVNLGAIREFEQLKERHDFLCEQRDDLINAVEDLHKVIRRINKITKKRFMDTFDQVNEKLSEVFPRLFEGGTAQLVLTEPDKPLETGVEFLIHPPGKKLTRMSLLSGGEKALSAIAFIFAIFLIKPTSFCLMDEIDAPLDDVNVFRFNDLLKIIGQKSQILMITHNKKTMEFADMLFGVTMENKGVSKIVSVNLNKSESLN